MVDFGIEELIGTFEVAAELEEKVSALKSQIKMVNTDIANRFKEFAKEKEIKVKAVKDAYKYWKHAQESDDDVENSDYFDLIARIDFLLEQEDSGSGD